MKIITSKIRHYIRRTALSPACGCTPLIILDQCLSHWKKLFSIESSTLSYCPVCSEPLSYRDSCKRLMLLEGRECHSYRYRIHCLKCHKCGKLHRELPNILTPYKQYAAEVISGVLDGIIIPDDEDSSDYPCVVTMHRWHDWLIANQKQIDGYLKSIGYHLLGFSEELLTSGMPLLFNLRRSTACWLETVLRFLYNSGGFLVAI